MFSEYRAALLLVLPSFYRATRLETDPVLSKEMCADSGWDLGSLSAAKLLRGRFERRDLLMLTHSALKPAFSLPSGTPPTTTSAHSLLVSKHTSSTCLFLFFTDGQLQNLWSSWGIMQYAVVARFWASTQSTVCGPSYTLYLHILYHTSLAAFPRPLNLNMAIKHGGWKQRNLENPLKYW